MRWRYGLRIVTIMATVVAVGMSGPPVFMARGEENTVRLWQLMMVGFACSRYARVQAKLDESSRLFKIGYDAGKRWLEKAPAKEKKEKKSGLVPYQDEVSADFALGLFYSLAANPYAEAARAKITPFSHAQAKYQEMNCVLIGTSSSRDGN